MHIDEKKRYDKRTIDRSLKEGVISHQEYNAYLTNLPDVSDKIFGRQEDMRSLRKKKNRS